VDAKKTPKSEPESSPVAEHADVYGRLAAPFDSTFRDTRGGVELEYITGEQCVSRLNETLGVGGWNFKVLEHGIHQEADECWVLGEITAGFGERTVTRQQFGSQKIKRSRSSGTPLDIGFDLKGAATDSLKKCASLIGVGLYLSRKEPVSDAPMLTAVSNGEPEALLCEECGDALTETRFKDGTNWAPAQLAGFGRRKHSRVLCMSHYREANQAKRRADEALQQVPF
jgi:Rad52/22 family double-strand break repair protein